MKPHAKPISTPISLTVTFPHLFVFFFFFWGLFSSFKLECSFDSPSEAFIFFLKPQNPIRLFHSKGSECRVDAHTSNATVISKSLSPTKVVLTV